MFAASKTAGAAAAVAANYIEDVFSTWLYQADGSSAQTVNNGIDLSTKGGMVWIKSRSNATNNAIFDTTRGFPKEINSNTTGAEYNATDEIGSATTTGFTVPYNTVYGDTNFQTRTYASWTFRKQPKFFDVVTYTGNGNTSQTIAHNLGSTPGFIIVKAIDLAGQDWRCYHTSLGATNSIRLNNTGGISTNAVWWNNTSPTSTNFTVGADSAVNYSGATYVAYLFAHNAGGFGLTGTDNVISCGRLTTGGAPATVDLGYEVQWLLTKELASGYGWNIYDIMKGDSVTGSQILQANTSGAELSDNTYFPYPTATGFGITTNFSNDMIYIAIRRGPMKVPTDATKVFSSVASSNANAPWFTSGFPVDWALQKNPNGVSDWFAGTRLLSGTSLRPNSTIAEFARASFVFDYMDGWNNTTGASSNAWSAMFRRAPSFFDEVCYTGTGSATTFSHNLQAVPELIIVKKRSAVENWCVYSSTVGNTGYLVLNTALAPYATSSTIWNNTSPTASVFSVGTNSLTNSNGATYVAYLFATCAGVSKVGSYTGNGTTQTINCGFTGGARFVFIKRTDSTGDWYVYDTARGMTTLTDPYLLLNSTAAESATLGSVTTVSTGFAVNASILAAINTNGASYIYLSIA